MDEEGLNTRWVSSFARKRRGISVGITTFAVGQAFRKKVQASLKSTEKRVRTVERNYHFRGLLRCRPGGLCRMGAHLLDKWRRNRVSAKEEPSGTGEGKQGAAL
jgi:hypothetical protein